MTRNPGVTHSSEVTGCTTSAPAESAASSAVTTQQASPPEALEANGDDCTGYAVCMTTEPVMHDSDEEHEQDIEGRYPEAVRKSDATDEVPNHRATETEPAITPPQATNG